MAPIDDHYTLQCVYTAVAKNIHDKSILKWQRCKLRSSTMKIILANQNMMDELSHMKNEQSRHGMSLLKKKSLYHLLASIPYDSSPNASDDSEYKAAKTDKTAYIMKMLIKCLLIIHTILLDQPITH